MRSALLRLAGVAGAALLVGCSVDEHISKAPLQHVDFGTGIADLYDDGHLEVTTLNGVSFGSRGPVFVVARDEGAPDDFHDSREQAEATWEPVAATGLTMDSPETGVLHLGLPSQTGAVVLAALDLDLDEGAYLGLGERFDGVDAKGRIVPMFFAIDGAVESGFNDAHVPVPFFADTRGYGVLVDSLEAGAFDVGVTLPDTVRAAFEGDRLDVRVFVPDSGAPVDAVAQFVRATGSPRRPPLWSLAPMHWRNEWPDAATLLADLDAYRTLHIPASTVWIDNPWQTSYNDATLDPARFGDTKALMRAIRDKGFRAIAWSTPYLEAPDGDPGDRAQQLYEEADANGWFVHADGKTWSAIGCCVDGALGMIDFTNPDASTFWQGVLASATGAGFSGFKLDYGEDLVTSIIGVRLSVDLADGETARTSRSYPLGYHDAYEAALAAAGSDGFVIGRASGLGGQAHVEAIWPGDLDNGFERRGDEVGGLPAAVIAAQTLAASGFPTFGSDTGGFRDGMPTREALLRWAEHTAFSVVMQLGGGGDHHNPWLYDDEAGLIYAGLARQHLGLVPYLDGLLAAAVADGSPTIRSLPLSYPSDAGGFAVADSEYLLGPDVLVAPVLEAGATKRSVHVPPGSWTHWFTGESFDGPADVDVEAPLGAPPVFARVGAVLPLYPTDIDTLIDAEEPGIVTLASRAADVEARAFVGAEAASARWPEGSTLAVDGGTSSVTLTWKPVAPVANVLVTLDLRRAAGAGGLWVASSAGVSIPKVSSEADVRAASGSAYAIDGDTLWLRLAGDASVTVAAN